MHISLHDKFVIIFAYSIAFVACTQQGKEEKKNKYITRLRKRFDDANHHRDVQSFQNNYDDHRE